MRQEIKQSIPLTAYFKPQLAESKSFCYHKALNICEQILIEAHELISRQGFSVILSVNGNASIEPRIGQILVYDAAAGSCNANTKLLCESATLKADE